MCRFMTLLGTFAFALILCACSSSPKQAAKSPHSDESAAEQSDAKAKQNRQRARFLRYDRS